MSQKSLSILLIILGLIMLFIDLWILPFLSYIYSLIQDVILLLLLLRVLVGLPLCIIGIIFAYFLVKESKSIHLIKKSMIFAIIGLAVLTIDLWLGYILHFTSTFGPYTGLFIRWITLFIRLLLGLPLFIIGIILVFSSSKKISPENLK